MPELPEVELARGYLEAAVLCQPIEEVLVEDERILSRITPAEIEQHLAKKSFRSVQRHGKRLFLELDGRLWLTIHLGMTGRLIYLQKGEDEPAHTRLLLRFQNGFCLAFDDLRIFGEAGLTASPSSFLAEAKTGPDALQVDREGFAEIMRGRRGAIKSLLLNQRLVSGIGNLYADEALFQAGIHPQSRGLNELQLGRLHSTIQEVLRTSISVQADFSRLPDSYLLRHRHPGGLCPRDGTLLKHEKLGGRTSYYCPEHQRPFDHKHLSDYRPAH
ncbi:Fpg/Nei family DNA glycosylase [Methanothrix sp.]|uniref:Fpg/Nei family DNA glycosylase n=1 Tax=Methanothrix sp. TaxID=90426 RepID=UPI003C74FB48